MEIIVVQPALDRVSPPGASKPVSARAGDRRHALTIVDEEPRLAFAAAAFSVTEGGAVLVPVVRTGPTTRHRLRGRHGRERHGHRQYGLHDHAGNADLRTRRLKLNVTVAAVDDAEAEGAEQATPAARQRGQRLAWVRRAAPR